MNLGEIKTNTLKNMGVYNENVQDENPGQQYEPMLTTFINDGYFLVCDRYRPVSHLTVNVFGRTMVPLTEIPNLNKIIAVTYMGLSRDRSANWSISKCGLFLEVCPVPGVDEMTVYYTGYPERMTKDVDIPQFQPEIAHSMLAAYAAYRLMGMYPIGDARMGEAFYAQFAQMLATIRPQQSGGGRDLFNQYSWRGVR